MDKKEALEIIRKNCTDGSQLREACEVFIPELKESEDERIRKAILSRLKDAKDQGCNTYGGAKIDECIAYLERQKEQKPTNSEKPKEWSEEDEDRRHDILLTLEALRSSAGSTDTTIVYQHLIDWLKSLRPQPHWKPSEEDLTALEYCAEHTCPELLSLYLELKKL